MGRIDSSCLTHDPLASSSSISLGSGHGSLDSPFGCHLPLDMPDVVAHCWESAWIDLGGEG